MNQIKMNGNRANFIKVTPKLATRWLSNKAKNRRITQQKINRYTRAMQIGEWIFNGDTIRFSKGEKLIDGQHRLMAVIESGKTIEALLIHGLTEEVFDIIDTGGMRTLGDILSIEGHDNANLLAATLRLLWLYNERKGSLNLNLSKTAATSGGTKVAPSNHELRLSFKDYPILDLSIAFATSARMKKLIQGSALAFTHYTILSLDDELGNQFFHKLDTGANLEEDSPIYLLRERLFRTDRKISKTEKIALTFKAWNLFKEGKKVKTLKWQRGKRGAKKSGEPFPLIENFST